MLDSDLAELYEVETRTFVQSIKRNIDRFPDDFASRVTPTRVSKLEITNCDLKLRRPSLSSLCLH